MAPNAQTSKQRSMRERQGFPELIPSLIRRSLFCSQTDRGSIEMSSSRVPEELGLWEWLWNMQKLISSALSTALDRLFRTSRLGPTEHLLKGIHPQVSSHGRVGWIVPGDLGENRVCVIGRCRACSSQRCPFCTAALTAAPAWFNFSYTVAFPGNLIVIPLGYITPHSKGFLY